MVYTDHAEGISLDMLYSNGSKQVVELVKIVALQYKSADTVFV